MPLAYAIFFEKGQIGFTPKYESDDVYRKGLDINTQPKKIIPLNLEVLPTTTTTTSNNNDNSEKNSGKEENGQPRTLLDIAALHVSDTL